jgi:tetratricopeptide (TPR) repeat protein
MFNRVLWTLDNEMDGGTFERLCTDLLGREGYRDIIPLGGTYDGGRDAEIRRFRGVVDTGGITFFQYSLEKGWENKLTRELHKVEERGHQIDFYVFVTSQKVTGYKRDKLRKMVENQYGWQLKIYDSEWFRHRLEESHPDLAVKYLGIPNLDDQRFSSSRTKPSVPQDQTAEAWQLYLQGKYELATVELKKLLHRGRQDALTWRALAWCQYSMFRYQEALVSINEAISLDEKNEESRSLKASILTEDGIQRGIKANLVLAKEIFSDIAKDSDLWIDHYNYGNVLQALGEYETAKQEFLIAVSQNPMQAEVWKNLGTVYYHLEKYEKEIDCYNKALAINGDLTEALISKGVTLLRIHNEAREAAELIDYAIDSDDSLAIHWPHAWYWLGRAYYQLGELETALKRVNEGLEVVPHHSGLLELKSQLLSDLWPESSRFVSEAISFYEFRMSVSPHDYNSLVELASLYYATGEQDLVWGLVEDCIGIDALSEYLALTCHRMEDLLTSLKYLPSYKRFRKVYTISGHIEYLSRQGIQPDENFEKTMFLIGLIPFGLACDLWASVPLEERTGITERVVSIVKDSISGSFPRVGRRLADSLDINSTDQAIDGMARILSIWSDVALLELSQQVGFTGGHFGLSANHLADSIVKHGDGLERWQSAIAANTLLELNEKLNVFREE